MLQAFLFITVFVTCGSSGSGCWTGVSMYSALTSLWVSKSRRSVSTIKQLFLSWTQLVFHHCALVLSFNKNKSNVQALDHSKIFLILHTNLSQPIVEKFRKKKSTSVRLFLSIGPACRKVKNL